MSKCWQCLGSLSYTCESKVPIMQTNVIEFSPPEIINYQIIKEEEDNDSRGSSYKKVEFLHYDYNNISYPWINVECYQLRKCTTKKKIILLHIKNNSYSNESKITIIHSHGNASDLGIVYPFLIDMSSHLKVDVISYDYSGYGRSEGTSSEQELYSDIEQVMDFCLIDLRIKLQNVILFGFSLGSIPSVHIAVHNSYCSVKGIILLAPISSGMKLVNPKLSITSEDLEKVNAFSNLAKAGDISSPVLLIHGKLDDVVPWGQSQEMAWKIKYAYEWYPTRGDHSNIVFKYRSKFFIKLKLFFEHLKYNKIRKNPHALDLSDESSLDQTRIKTNRSKKLSAIKCEENYIFSNTEKKNSPLGSIYYKLIENVLVIIIEENTLNSKEKSPVINCISVQRRNYFDIIPNSNSSCEKNINRSESECVLTKEKLSYGNFNDEKELEYQYNQTEKNVQI